MIYQKIQHKHFIFLPFGYSLHLTLQKRHYKTITYTIPLIRLLNKKRTLSLINFLSW